MTALKLIFHSSILFWAAWIAVPIVMEIIPKVIAFFILLRKKMKNEVRKEISFHPEITLMIPVHNSAANIHRCVKSINDSIYDRKQINILFVDEMSTDNSFEIYRQCQEEFRDLKMNWVQSKQGKSQVLNLALYNSYGKYVICMDCEGVLHPDAIYNMVRKFELNPEVHCMTGTIMTNPKMIGETPSVFKRLLRKIEYYDYCQGLFIRHNFQSVLDNIFTMSGAFYGFRRSTILKTQFYNTENVSDDVYVSFRIGELGRKKIALCNDAIFFVNPSETLDDFYQQRQRWQQEEVEVLQMLSKQHGETKKECLSDFVNRLYIFDHAFTFPRIIWYLTLICVGLIKYSFPVILQASIVMYGVYALSTALLYLCVVLFLEPFRTLQTYNARKVYMILLMPIYNLIIFGVRAANAIDAKLLEAAKMDSVFDRNSINMIVTKEKIL